ncbi:MAG: hypothetical protein AB7S38_08560 [Vulcanimicrobiota bacterium]
MSQLAKVALLVLILPTLAFVHQNREEFLLEAAPAAKVMDFLEKEYPAVRLEPHETLNGFYATGSDADLDKLRAEIPNLDRVPEPPPLPIYAPAGARFVVYTDFDSTISILRRAFPEAIIRAESRLEMFVVEGLAGDDMDRFNRALKLLDKPRSRRE